MEKYTIKMSEISTFNKNEKKLISYIIKCSINQKIAEITIDEKKILQITRVEKNNLHKFLNRLASKLIHIEIKEHREIFNMTTNIFTILEHYELFVFIVSPIIFNSITGDDYFSKFDLHYFFTMEEKKSYKLYNFLINIKDSFVDIGIAELKTMINESDIHYQRFFDFEKNTIKPIVNDINLNTNISIKYSKNRHGKQISTLSFFIENSKMLDTDQVINSFFERFNIKFKNVAIITKKINYLLNFYSKNDLESYFKYLSNKYLTNYSEELILKSLDMPIVKKYFSSNLYYFEHFNTSIELFNFLHKELEKLNLNVEINQNFFPPELLILAYSGTLTDFRFQNDILKVDIHFVPEKKSSIIISFF